jgi:hypothetical protein
MSDKITWYPGQKVRLLEKYTTAPAGTEGVVKYVTNHPKYPVRVYFPGYTGVYKPGELIFGMDDLGWLMQTDEVEPIDD